MSLTFGYSPIWLLPALLIAGALTYWTYRSTQPELPRWKRGLLGGLRMSALTILILLLLEPVIHRIQQIERAPTLAVLIDESQSLQVAGESREAVANQVRAALEAVRGSDLADQARIYRFASGARTGDLEMGDSVSMDGPRTNIARAIRTARRDLESENLRAMLLLTDGQYNTGRNPIYEAGESPVPIFSVALGDTTRPRDLQIRSVRTNDIAYRDTELPVRVHLRSRGFGGRSVTVSLHQGERRIDSTATTLAEGPSETTVELRFVPEELGLQQYQLRVSELEGEQTFENNSAYTQVRVLERENQLLLVAGAPSPDVSSWTEMLERRTETEVTTRVQKGPGTFYGGELPDSLAAFDGLLLFGYPGPASEPATVDRLAQAAADLPTLYVHQRQTNEEMLRERLFEAIPAHPETVRPGFQAATWATTRSGRTHPILRLSSRDSVDWPQLPPILYPRSSWTASPDSRVLATIREQGVVLDRPLLVVRQRSGRRSAALLATETYRWHNVPERLGRSGEQWTEIAANAIQWLTTREADQPVRVQPTQSVFDSRETVTFTGQVYDESLEPIDDADVEVSITAPDETSTPYPMDAEGSGQYRLTVGTLPAGTYEYTATGRLDGEVLGEDQGTFAVGSVALEYLAPRANPSLLQQISLRSGGQLVPADRIEALPEILRESASFDPQIEERPREAHLWRWPGLLVLVVALLTGEWTFRKRHGLT